MGEDDAAEAGPAGGEFSGEAVVREIEVLQVGPIKEVDSEGEAIVVESEQPESREPSEGPSGASKVEAIENQVGDSAMAVADAVPRPRTWVNRIGLGGERIELV